MSNTIADNCNNNNDKNDGDDDNGDYDKCNEPKLECVIYSFWEVLEGDVSKQNPQSSITSIPCPQACLSATYIQLLSLCRRLISVYTEQVSK